MTATSDKGAVGTTAHRRPGPVCTVCASPSRAEIDDAILGGASDVSLAKQFGVTRSAAQRHRASHVPTEAMQTAIAERAEAEGQHGASLLESAAELRSKAMCLLRQAEEAGDLKTALVGVREASRTIELMAKLSGQLDDSVKLNIVMAPALIELQTIVLSALADHPAARMAVAAALGNLAAPSMPAMIEYRPQP